MILMTRLFLIASLCVAGSISQAQELTARQIIDRVLAGFPKGDFLALAKLTFPGENGQERNLTVQLLTRSQGGNISSVIVAMTPTNLLGHAVLSTLSKDGTYAMYRRIPGAEDSRERVKPRELDRSFLGTDFAYEDFDFSFLHWPTHRLVGENRRQARDCYMIESIPADGQSAQYSKVVSWIDKEHGMLMLAEGYDRHGKLLKVFDIRSLKMFEGGWFIKVMNLKNVPAKRQTRLEVTHFEFARNLDERFFSPESFGRLAAFKVVHGTKEF